MTKQITALIRAVAATGLLLGAYTTAYAETGEGAGRFHIDCQNGYKYGDHPGEIVRGWTCQYHGLTEPASPAAQAAAMGTDLRNGVPPQARIEVQHNIRYAAGVTLEGASPSGLAAIE